MEISPERVSTLKANGTCLQGNILTTFDNLTKAFGPPVSLNSGDGKVLCEWVLEFERGTVATIYCWKVNNVPMDEYNWHIGGHSKKAVDCVKNFLELRS